MRPESSRSFPSSSGDGSLGARSGGGAFACAATPDRVLTQRDSLGPSIGEQLEERVLSVLKVGHVVRAFGEKRSHLGGRQAVGEELEQQLRGFGGRGRA